MNWLRLFLKMFYAPGRALEEIAMRTPLAAALLLAFLTHALYLFYTKSLYLGSRFLARAALGLIVVLFETFSSILFLALIFVPAIVIIANLFERRGSFGLVLRQEYAATASTIFYAVAAANFIALPLAYLSHHGGFEARVITETMTILSQWSAGLPQEMATVAIVQRLEETFFYELTLPLLGFWLVMAVRQVFRFSVLRALLVVLLGSVVMLFVGPLLSPIFRWVFASPLLLVLFFLLLRGHLSDVMTSQRARASFRRNLEAATLNPADASAHYNLGLIHQQRGELSEARQRFTRAIEIDPEEIDAHYQLGRIARAEGKLPEAIGHFEQVVSRDQSHAQHEIWREIGATYLEAGQFMDARDALERFLEHRPSDPQGLYLMGRAHAGLGHTREAANSMQACIEAVKTAPAYKYRTEKRWLNEAQQFLRSQQV